MANRNVPLVWGVIGIGGGIILSILGGVPGMIAGAVLIIFGWMSLKSAVFGSNREIEELSGERPVSRETERSLRDRF
jgi:hypothetical protein